MKRLVVGVLAHVDSGKTTLSESMLYLSGNIRKLGRVDHKDAFLDSYELEKDRGITIFSKQAIMDYNGMKVTLLDTPGHVDFSAEMERTLQVLDYAILVISGTDKVQSHTETLWKLLRKHNIPTFIFVNKMDLQGSEKDLILEELQSKLSPNVIDFMDNNSLFENIAMCSENAMEEFLNSGEINIDTIKEDIYSSNVYPCYFGSALKLEGVETFLNDINKYTKDIECKKDFAAKVFKITRDEQGVRLTHLKVTGGSLKVKTVISDVDSNGDEYSEKIDRIRVYSGAKFSSAEEVVAGDVCAVTGLNSTYPGQALGSEKKSLPPMLEPVLTYKVEIPPEYDVSTVLSKLRILGEEDPQLSVTWNDALQEIHVQLMGEIQLEILKSIILDRFLMKLEFGKGSILYKETIENTALGVGHFEPLRHYAEVHLLLEPLERGAGLKIAARCSEDVLDRNWQRLILTHLKERIYTGVLTNSPITDMKITLVTGRAHQKHTEGGDFRQATYRAVRQGLMQAKSIILEPWYNFTLQVPTENIGRAMSDVTRLCGEFSSPITQGENSILKGSAPVSTMRDYHIEVTNYTRGKGRLALELKGYDKCHNASEVYEDINYQCENDVYNTADSVFCSHGAGYNVKWDEVKNHMHLESVLEKNQPTNYTQPISKSSVASYCGTLEQDKELMAIFEKTYGPIKRDVYRAFTPTTSNIDTVSVREYEKEYLLVDGYNILFAWDDLKDIASENLDAARNTLINRMCNYSGFKKCELILVFDAYKMKNNSGAIEKVNNIHVVYTKEAETADMYIEKVTHELGRKNKVRVASSDNLEQLIILGHGAYGISANAFHEEVKQVEKAIREFLT